AFNGISEAEAINTVIAYEPIWAIGTGKTATSDQAEEVCKFIREVIGSIYNDKVKNEIRIQYGGSVKASNAKELFEKENIDGGLIGGASLKEEFIDIVNY
ncbi:MAG: triosephosphate isomerase, partial [Lachnospiraceae bacterium]|nr:triosephosphate isomerase [Lachnospiraceae bacterium]